MSQKCGINIENFWGQIQEPGIKQKCFILQLKMMLQEAYFEIFPRSDTRACPQRLASNRMDWPMQKTFPRISNNNMTNNNNNNNNNKNNRNNNNNNNNTHSRILKMGCLRNFISLRSIPIWLGGACAAPQSKWASPQDLWLWTISKNTPFSKTRFWEGKDFLVQSAAQKWPSLQKMILSTRWSFWQEMSHFHFSPWKRSKGGTIGGIYWKIRFPQNFKFYPTLVTILILSIDQTFLTH